MSSSPNLNQKKIKSGKKTSHPGTRERDGRCVDESRMGQGSHGGVAFVS